MPFLWRTTIIPVIATATIAITPIISNHCSLASVLTSVGSSEGDADGTIEGKDEEVGCGEADVAGSVAEPEGEAVDEGIG